MGVGHREVPTGMSEEEDRAEARSEVREEMNEAEALAEGHDGPEAFRRENAAMWRSLVGSMPSVTAEHNSLEWREQMRAQAVWMIRERHEKCAGCSKLRDPDDWNGRCTFCGASVCSMACFYDHTRGCK